MLVLLWGVHAVWHLCLLLCLLLLLLLLLQAWAIAAELCPGALCFLRLIDS
jgi:hypothetical protein